MQRSFEGHVVSAGESVYEWREISDRYFGLTAASFSNSEDRRQSFIDNLVPSATEIQQKCHTRRNRERLNRHRIQTADEISEYFLRIFEGTADKESARKAAIDVFLSVGDHRTAAGIAEVPDTNSESESKNTAKNDSSKRSKIVEAA
ncbi:MAG: hypothetical protein R2684_10500 [Pyrinomonadaceae bacterium]